MDYKIAIIEDDETISGLLKEHLCRWGYDAVCVDDFKNVAVKIASLEPHLILLDIMLPYFNGFYWCEEIRKLSKVPIIFISSASDNMNIIMAMNMGGDDFVTKPFDMNVLTAKLQAVLRRTYSFQGQVNTVECGGAVLNLSDCSMLYNGQKIDLTKNDFRILEMLMTNSGRVVSRDEIMQKLWENEAFIDDNTLTVNMARLRRKLEEAGMSDFIKTKKGIGYIIC